jgi:hypothetical protein
MKITKRFFTNPLLVFFTSMIVSNLAGQSCPVNMISYWKLQESSGPTYADSYGSHDAAASSAPFQIDGVSGKGQYFTSSSSNGIIVPDHSDFDWAGTASFSIEFWVKYTDIGSVKVFIGRDDASNDVQWWIGQTATGRIRWEMYDSDGGSSLGIESAAAYNTGQWVHVVAVRNGSTDVNSLYVNAGTPVTSTVDFNGNFASSASISFGQLIFDGTPSFFYSGGIDEVAIYSRVLDPTEITTHYDNARLYEIGYCDDDAPAFLSSPKIQATVGQPYTYDVDASGNPLPTYSLLEYPSGMTINETTGVISWTPASASANGHVVVQAENTEGTAEQSFNIYLAEAPDCRNGLTAYWDFDEAISPYVDNISDFELHGESPSIASGLVDGALSFDGINDSLNLDKTGDPFYFDLIDPNWSIEVWIKSSATPAVPMVLLGRDNLGTPNDEHTYWWFGINTNGTPRAYMQDYTAAPATPKLADISATTNVLDGDWHHLVLTYNSSTDALKLYVDKQEEASESINFINFGCDDQLNVGYFNSGGTIDFWYEGLMDELGFYNTELSSGEITNNFNAAQSGSGACTYNYAPVIVSNPETEVNEDEEYSYEFQASDIDEDVLSISYTTKPAWLEFTYNATDTFAVLNGTPTDAEIGTHNVTLRVSDGSISVDQSFTIEVINVNDEPVITSSPLLVAYEDLQYTYHVTATDEDTDDELTISANVLPSWLEFRNDSIVGTPGPSDLGFHDVTVQVSDGTVNVPQSFQIEVRATNDPPEFTSFPVTSADDYEEYSYTYAASDDDGDDLTFTLVTAPDWLEHDVATQTLSGTPLWDDAGQVFDVSLTVSDGYLEDTQDFQITVGNDNDAPVFTSTPSTTIDAGDEYSYQMEASDVDKDDTLEFSVEYAPSWLNFIEATNSLIGTPANEDEGANAVIVKVTDGKVDVVQNFTITVNSDQTAISTQESTSLLVYPNPAKEHLMFEFISAGEVKIAIYDLTGNLQLEMNSQLSRQETLEIEVSDLSNGIYIYKAFVNDEIITGKFTKN